MTHSLFTPQFVIIKVNDWIPKNKRTAPKKTGKKEKATKHETPIKKNRFNFQPLDTQPGQRVRSKKFKVFRSPSKLPPHKAGKTLSKVQREKLQRKLPISQLPSSGISRTLHKLVDKKVRGQRVQYAGNRKPKNKKVDKGRIGVPNPKISMKHKRHK